MPETAIYCDYNAGAPIRVSALTALAEVAALSGNASSVHRFGRVAKARLEAAREAIADRIGAGVANLVFTSGATEALHLALDAPRGVAKSLIVSAIEHDAVDGYAAAAFGDVVRLGVTPQGVIDLAQLQQVLADVSQPALVAVMLANNETGAIQPVKEAAHLVRAAGGLLLVDASQAPGRIAVNLQALGADYLVLSSHKIGGPPGAGALALAPGAPFVANRAGGGQERGRRPGTENIPAIVGFAAALVEAEAARSVEAPRVAALRDAFEAGLKAAHPDVTIFAEVAPRLPNTSCFALPGLRSETALIALDLAGVAVSSGAACSSGKVRASRVLTAMGVSPSLAGAALRVSFGWCNAPEDGAKVLTALAKARAQAHKREDARRIPEGAA
jgi:cysteine desulfurase